MRLSRKIISPDRFVPLTRSELDPEYVQHVCTLMEHFGVERKRVARAAGRTISAVAVGTTMGRVSKYLNKLNEGNFVVVSHGIFRLLVDDSAVSVEKVFDRIMEYACTYPRNSHLFAKVCADLKRMYPNLPAHISSRIAAAHAGLRGEAAEALPLEGGPGPVEAPRRGGADAAGREPPEAARSEYCAYLADVTKRRRTCGFFVFVCKLHAQGVVPASLLGAQVAALVAVVLSSAPRVAGGSDARGGGGPAGAQLIAYCDCLGSILKATAGWIGTDPAHGRSAVSRLRQGLHKFSVARRPPDYPSKVWYGLLDLYELALNTSRGCTSKEHKCRRRVPLPRSKWTGERRTATATATAAAAAAGARRPIVRTGRAAVI